MRILLISSCALKSPPKNYGGLERCVYEYARGLQELGHVVTLVASKESKAPPNVELIETVPSWDGFNPAQAQHYAKNDGIWREWNGQKWFARTWNGWRRHEEEAYLMYKDKIGSFDVIGDASWAKWSYTSKKDEIVGTCHSIKPYQSKPPREYAMFAGVSNGHARFLTRDLKTPVRAILNPVNVEEFHVVRQKTDRVLSLNRIMPQKGIHHFVRMAEQEKFKADVVGDDSTLVPDQGYVQTIKQKCANSGNIVYHGLVPDQKRRQMLEDAKCLVCFKDFGYEEIFGISAVEALSCGTPVIATRSWGFEDIIEEGKTGFICDSIEDVSKAVRKVVEGQVQLDANECRKGAERFSTKERSKAYARILEKVKNGSRW